MRHLIWALIGLALLFLAASPAFAGEVCEGDGYKIRIPDGFKEAMSMSGTGDMKVKSNFGMLPIDGTPETTIYVAGDLANQRGSVIVARVNIKSGHEVANIDDMGLDELEAMQARMPEGFEMNLRKVGKYDAVEMKMSMEMMDEEMTMRMLAVAGGDFVMVVMLQTVDAHYPSADGMWTTMVDGMEVSSGTNKLLLYGGVGFGALILLVMVTKLTGKKEGSGYVEVNDWRGTGAAGAAGRPGRLDATRARPGQLPMSRPPPGATGSAGQSAAAAKADNGRPFVAPPSGRPGLRPTRPASGNWSDGAPR